MSFFNHNAYISIHLSFPQECQPLKIKWFRPVPELANKPLKTKSSLIADIHKKKFIETDLNKLSV